MNLSPSFLLILIFSRLILSQQQSQQPVLLQFPNSWQVSYAIEADVIYFLIAGKNNGYIAMGISYNQTPLSADMDVVSFKYENGKVIIEDRSNIEFSSQDRFVLDKLRNPPGTEDYVLDETGDEPLYNPTTNVWNVIFHRKLNTQDKYDIQIQNNQPFYISLALLNDFSWTLQPSFKTSIKQDQAPESSSNTIQLPSNQQSNEANNKEICYQGICFKPYNNLTDRIFSLQLTNQIIFFYIIQLLF